MACAIIILFTVLVALAWLTQMVETKRKRKRVSNAYKRKLLDAIREHEEEHGYQKEFYVEVDGEKVRVINLGE